MELEDWESGDNPIKEHKNIWVCIPHCQEAIDRLTLSEILKVDKKRPMDKVVKEANSKQKGTGGTMKKSYNSIQQWATLQRAFVDVAWFWVAFHIQAMFPTYTSLSLDFLTLSSLRQENATISNLDS